MIAHLCAGTNVRDAKCVAAVCWQAEIFVILGFIWVSITMLTDHTFSYVIYNVWIEVYQKDLCSLAFAGHH